VTAPVAAPSGFVAVEIGKGGTLVIPERIYLAGLKLGKSLRRREAEAKRSRATDSPVVPDYWNSSFQLIFSTICIKLPASDNRFA
jgi:hypothetical protein